MAAPYSPRASRAAPPTGGAGLAQDKDDFYFVQLSDTHWGFEGKAVNPDARGTLPKAIAAVNALEVQPDFVIFTGDLTHTTDNPIERRKRLTEFRDIVAQLKVKTVRFMPGEHDASLDHGKAFMEFFGDTHYTFDHKGVHFVVVDNVSDPAARIGDEQLAWLADDLAKQPPDARIVVFTHRPLFDLAPQWDWATRDGAKAVEILHDAAQHDGLLRPHPPGEPPHDGPHRAPFGEVAHLPAARADVAAHPHADSVGRRASLPRARLPRGGGRGPRREARDQRAARGEGLTVRQDRRKAIAGLAGLAGLAALAMGGAAVVAQPAPRVIKVSARRFTYTPNVIELKRGEPVTLELTTADVFMGFNAPDFNVRSDIVPGKTMTLGFTPEKAGTFIFLCDVFCGDGHETMSGKFVVS